MTKRVLYGVANYVEIVDKNGYFVDKTAYIKTLERIQNPVFLRPRRFGKSLLCRMLECYYNIGQKDDFERLFGHTAIGRQPTPSHSSYFVWHVDFSTVDPTGTVDEIERDFDKVCNGRMKMIVGVYKRWFQNKVTIQMDDSASANLRQVLNFIGENKLPPLYVIIDEYDNFVNQLITANKDELYHRLTADDSFFKTFFKTLKEGRKTGEISNIFITGVLPITMDDLASGFNIAKFITLDPEFESMLGFTQKEVDTLLDEIYQDYQIDPNTRPEIDDLIRNYYNGYHFVTFDGEAIYNPTILMNFLFDFTRYKAIPEFLIDLNLRTDLSWVRRITGANPSNTEEFVDQLTTQNNIYYDKNYLVTKFNMFQFFEKGFYPLSFYYLGMLTKQDNFYLKLPNVTMRQIFVEYFNELHQIDVSTKYAEMMQSFVNKPDLPKLFANYWRLYVSQLPETIFQQVNENFYRTTFFELCSRYLSTWFTWNVERSYPQGKSDLEFVGKYHEKFAGLRFVIEFKYYSNTEFKKLKQPIAEFQLKAGDKQQLAGYVEGLRQQYPEARVTQFVIYCFGNQGFRVFELPAT